MKAPTRATRAAELLSLVPAPVNVAGVFSPDPEPAPVLPEWEPDSELGVATAGML